MSLSGDKCWPRLTSTTIGGTVQVVRQAVVATTNCIKLKQLKNIFSPFALIKYHPGNPSHVRRILSRSRGISPPWPCAK